MKWRRHGEEWAWGRILFGKFKLEMNNRYVSRGMCRREFDTPVWSSKEGSELQECTECSG